MNMITTDELLNYYTEHPEAKTQLSPAFQVVLRLLSDSTTKGPQPQADTTAANTQQTTAPISPGMPAARPQGRHSQSQPQGVTQKNEKHKKNQTRTKGTEATNMPQMQKNLH